MMDADVELEPDMPSAEVDNLLQTGNPPNADELIIEFQRKVMSLEKDLQVANTQGMKVSTLYQSYSALTYT